MEKCMKIIMIISFCSWLCVDRRHSILKKFPLMLKKTISISILRMPPIKLQCCNGIYHLFAISNIAMSQFVAICSTDDESSKTIDWREIKMILCILFKGKHTLLFHSYSNLYLFPSNQERNNNIIVIRCMLWL